MGTEVLEEDPLQAALDEAESLMSELETAPSATSVDGDVGGNGDEVIANFSIDSSEEDPLSNSNAARTAKDESKEEDAKDSSGFHPLHADFLPSPSTNAPVGIEKPQPQQSLMPPSPAPVTQQPSTVSAHSYSPNIPTTSNATSSKAAGPNVAAAAPSLDVFKAQTTRFASNLANMAQRGLSQVAIAASGTSTATTMTPSSSFGGFASGSIIAGTPTTPGTATNLSSTPPPSSSLPPHLQPPQQQQQQQQQPTPITPSAAMVPVELDNEQKMTLIHTHVGELLPGERLLMFLSNLLHVSDSTGFSYSHTAQPNVMWCCAMTYYRIILFGTHPVSGPACPPNWNAACWPSLPTYNVVQMPLASMDRVEKSVFSSGATAAVINPTTLMGLLIHGKDNGRQLRFTTPSYADTLRAHELLQTYSFPGRRNLGYLFAFESKREQVMASVTTEEGTGKKTVTLEPVRKRFEALHEFGRQMQIPTTATTSSAGTTTSTTAAPRPWAIWSNVNPNYQLCMSYPNILVGPASLDENNPEAQHLIRQCAAFRSEQRLPALTWTSGTDGASLWRCAQPKIGLQGNRSTADELYLKHIMEGAAAANALADANSTKPPSLSRAMLVQLTGTSELTQWLPEPNCALKILDLRPRSAAMANRTAGYGYENTSNYPGSTLQFCNIGNIHAVRDAYQKVSALCNSVQTPDLQWNSSIEDTKWMSLVRLILAASWETAFWIHVHRLPVLLHCSHGWDRTSQVAALAQLLLDPYYRTREGFAVLVEKDFLSFGHPFHTRCAHGEGRGGDKGGSGNNGSGGGGSDEGQISPVFMQFLDCVFQLVHQYPECFEFNTKYLLLLSEHVYSCRFGNFLCDTEREREMVAGIRQRTNSLWDYLDSRADVVSDLYTSSRSSGVLLMPLSTLLRNVTLWTDRHCMHGAKPTARRLPSDVERPEDPYFREQHAPLHTQYQDRKLLYGGTTTLAVPAAVSSGGSTTSQDEAAFTIDD